MLIEAVHCPTQKSCGSRSRNRSGRRDDRCLRAIHLVVIEKPSLQRGIGPPAEITTTAGTVISDGSLEVRVTASSDASANGRLTLP